MPLTYGDVKLYLYQSLLHVLACSVLKYTVGAALPSAQRADGWSLIAQVPEVAYQPSYPAPILQDQRLDALTRPLRNVSQLSKHPVFIHSLRYVINNLSRIVNPKAVMIESEDGRLTSLSRLARDT